MAPVWVMPHIWFPEAAGVREGATRLEAWVRLARAAGGAVRGRAERGGLADGAVEHERGREHVWDVGHDEDGEGGLHRGEDHQPARQLQQHAVLRRARQRVD